MGLNWLSAFLIEIFRLLLLSFMVILFFAYCPFQLGHLAIKLLHGNVEETLENIVAVLYGYCLIGVAALLILNTITTFNGYRLYFYNFCCIVLKVFLLLVVEAGVLPFLCGWWLDICSLPLLDKTLKNRLESFYLFPGPSTLVHWAVGFMFMTLFLLSVRLREVLRPGVLWFLHDLNDPNTDLITVLIRQTFLQHGQIIMTFTVMFGTTIFLVVRFPICILKIIWPSFFPLFTIDNDLIFEGFLVDLTLLIFFPLLAKIILGDTCLKTLMCLWCHIVSKILGIKSYLLGDGEETPLGVRAAHERVLRLDGTVEFQPYTRPNNFAVRLICLVIVVVISMVLISLLFMILPVWLGGLVISDSSEVSAMSDQQFLNLDKFFQVFGGIFIVMLPMRLIFSITTSLPNRWRIIMNRIILWFKVGLKIVVVIFVSCGIIPLLFGLIASLVFIHPKRIPLKQTPLIWMSAQWSEGMDYTVLYMTIARIFLMNGFGRFDFKSFIRNLAVPIISYFSLFLAIPYVFAYSVVPLAINCEDTILIIARYIYPVVMAILIIGFIVKLLIRVYNKIYNNYKNRKYLECRRLLNFTPTNSNSG